MIINGNCLEVLTRIPMVGASQRIMFADPPDNIGLAYKGYDDSALSKENYYLWLKLLIMEVLPKCRLFWLTYNHIHDLEVCWMVRDIVKYRHPGWEVEKYIWRYTFSQYNDYDCAYGYRPMLRMKRNDNIKMNVEAIREVSKRQLLGDPRAVGRRVPDNVWSVPRVVGNSVERVDWMPTQLPIELMKRVISFSLVDDNSKEETFIDLFGGSGSSLMAGKELGLKTKRVKIVEIDSFSCEKIKERLNSDEIEIIRFDDMFQWAD